MVMTEACQHVARARPELVQDARPHAGDPQARGLGRLARRPARRGGPAVPALSAADGGGADGGELGEAVTDRGHSLEGYPLTELLATVGLPTHILCVHEGSSSSPAVP